MDTLALVLDINILHDFFSILFITYRMGIKSIFWSNGDRAEKSTKFRERTRLARNFDFEGVAASGCEQNV